MSEPNSILLTLITENQIHRTKAEKLADGIQNELGEDWMVVTVEKYYKFENSYKLEFKCVAHAKDRSELNTLAIRLTDKLVSPWVVYFEKDENSIELIFNRDENTHARKTEYAVIKWGHLQITQ